MMIYDRAEGPIPRHDSVRRVPTCYQSTLPLDVIKRFQCLVVGSSRGVLTVAITDIRDRSLIDTLEKLTGRQIFMVLIEPARMRMLIKRLERSHDRRCNKQTVGRPYYLHSMQLSAIARMTFNAK